MISAACHNCDCQLIACKITFWAVSDGSAAGSEYSPAR
jgi:hypothetical protein